MGALVDWVWSLQPGLASLLIPYARFKFLRNRVVHLMGAPLFAVFAVLGRSKCSDPFLGKIFLTFSCLLLSGLSALQSPLF